jgi:phenylacetate-CoA ligase
MREAAPENLGRLELTRLQEDRLRRLLAHALPRNRFYAAKLGAAGLDPAEVRGLADLPRLPFTTKAELLRDQELHPPYGRLLTRELPRYCRLHQTSGTSGRPLRWLDTPESWNALLDSWAAFFRIIGLRPDDRAFFPFSFGPFLGFWTAFEAAARLGCLCLPGGGMSSAARLRFLLDNGTTAVFCTPTYALRLAEVARQEGIDLGRAGVRALIVAGEPGGSIPATRARIEEAWQARVFDHTGMTEIGPLGIECPEQPGGIHPLESDFVVEVIDPPTGQAVPPGTPGELVVTTLHRIDSPLLRYRTGDLVCIDPGPCACGRALVRLDGGICGRVDDMIVLRGNNVHPSALQTILHRFVEVVEYRVEVDRSGPLPELRIEIEPHTPVGDGSAGASPSQPGTGLAERVAQAVRDELLFRAEVRAVAPGSLPRFELKAQRVVRKNNPGSATGPGTC